MTLLVWIAVALMAVGAVMLIAGIGATGLWIDRGRHRVGRNRPDSTPARIGFVGPGTFGDRREGAT